MKQEEFNKYSDMYCRIKNKMNNIQMAIHYGLSNEDKAFLEIVSDLLEENKNKKLHGKIKIMPNANVK